MIDRAKVIKGLECCLKESDHLYSNPCNGCPYEGQECIDRMKADALALLKEAKQGKWERQYSRPGVYANLLWWCSVCGEPTRYNDAGIFYKYCPRCGAKLELCIVT